jgi:hypothetical protein
MVLAKRGGGRGSLSSAGGADTAQRSYHLQRKKNARGRLMIARIAFAWRCYAGRLHRLRALSALRIQRRFRGQRSRRQLVRLLAARIIQGYVRRFLPRLATKKAALLATAVVRIQRAFISRQRRRCVLMQKLARTAVSAAALRQARLVQETRDERARLLRVRSQATARLIKDQLGVSLRQRECSLLDGELARSPSSALDLFAAQNYHIHGCSSGDQSRVIQQEAEKMAQDLMRTAVRRSAGRTRVRNVVHESRQSKLQLLSGDIARTISRGLAPSSTPPTRSWSTSPSNTRSGASGGVQSEGPSLLPNVKSLQSRYGWPQRPKREPAITGST